MSMYSERDLLSCSRWRHKKTGGLYRVLFVAACATNGAAGRAVVYRRDNDYPVDGDYFYRDVAEFLDGRFEPEPA